MVSAVNVQESISEIKNALVNMREELISIMRIGFKDPKLGMQYAPHYLDHDDFFKYDKDRTIFKDPVAL